jgi:hypothetical protein
LFVVIEERNKKRFAWLLMSCSVTPTGKGLLFELQIQLEFDMEIKGIPTSGPSLLNLGTDQMRNEAVYILPVFIRGTCCCHRMVLVKLSLLFNP